jgi:uncharacterized protein
LFCSDAEFDDFVDLRLNAGSQFVSDLLGKHLLRYADDEQSVQMLSTKLRTRKGHLRYFTTLHMVVVTNYCNCECIYCQASSCAPVAGSRSMTSQVAKKTVDMIFNAPSPSVKIEFQGGEPLLNWPVIKEIIEYSEEASRNTGKEVGFVICTNLTRVSREQLAYMRDHSIHISTSLDGPREIHDINRPSRDGSSSYDAFSKNLLLAREMMGPDACSPLLTITRRTLGRLTDVVEEYMQMGFGGVFLRPLNPYGSAVTAVEEIGYRPQEFLDAYKGALEYIIEQNLNGRRFVEYYARLLLTRVLTPFATGFVDLQSPAGAGISGAIYDFDGSVYPADEGRMLASMGDARFRLGSVLNDDYASIFAGQSLRDIISSTCVEVMPGCSHCAYQLYCGADPVRNYVETGDVVGHRPTSEFCSRNMGILTMLFDYLHDADSRVIDVFWSWITDRSLDEVRSCG